MSDLFPSTSGQSLNSTQQSSTNDNLESAQQQQLDYELLFEHFRKSLKYPFKIRNAISANLDENTMDLIIFKYKMLDTRERLGFLMAMMPRKSLQENVKSRVGELIDIALNDEDERVVVLAKRIKPINTLNTINLTVVDSKLLMLEKLDTRLIPLESRYLSSKNLKMIYNNVNIGPLVVFKNDFIKDVKTRLNSYGITNISNSNDVMVEKRPAIVRRTSSLFHDADIPTRPTPTKSLQPMFRPNKTKFLDTVQVQKLSENLQKEQDALREAKEKAKEEKKLLKDKMEEEKRARKEEKRKRMERKFHD